MTEPVGDLGTGQGGGGGFGEIGGQRLDQALHLGVRAGLARAVLAPVLEQALPAETRAGGYCGSTGLPDGSQGDILGGEVGLCQTARLPLRQDVVALLA